jgi:hypothetical protein
MAAEAESIFRYLVPSPDTRLITRTLVVQVVYGSFLAVVIWPLGVFPSWIVLAVYVAWVVLAGGTILLVSLIFKRSRIAIGPAGLVFGALFWRTKVNWPEVESVAFEELRLRLPFENLLRGDTSAPRVRIDLRRPKLFVTAPGRKFLSVYLDGAERFVHEVQEHLSLAAG